MDWGAFLSAFGLVFVAELGDKTQLAVVTQTCKHRHPWAVFAGASAALIVVTALGALGGQVLGRVVPPRVLHIAAAVAFTVMGALVAREAYRAGRGRSSGDSCENPFTGPTEGASSAPWDWRAFSSTFGLLFLAELGDKTQLAVLSLSSQHRDVWPVFGGGALALTLVTALGVLGGQGLSRLIPEPVLLWVSASAFIVMGILMGAGLL
jgi:putative Ca2+/H+ antiporter (TMEM165/GDT1 family)